MIWLAKTIQGDETYAFGYSEDISITQFGWCLLGDHPQFRDDQRLAEHWFFKLGISSISGKCLRAEEQRPRLRMYLLPHRHFIWHAA
jgi:hypothetical protein